jgi:hypothetical protein
MSEPTEVMFRPAKGEDDLKFILKSWIRSYARSPYAGAMTRSRLVGAIKGTIGDLLRREDCVATMACNPNNSDQIFGFVVYETNCDTPVLHYVYVKAPFRGFEIGSDLVSVARGNRPGLMRYTFRTPASKKFLAGAKFEPNLARRDLKERK